MPFSPDRPCLHPSLIPVTPRSKEVLYDPIKKVCDAYPAWMEEQGEALPAAELAGYREQHSIMKQLCNLYESNEVEGAELTRRVLELMDRMQQHGKPPKEIMESMGIELGEDGLPKVPADGLPQQCAIM